MSKKLQQLTTSVKHFIKNSKSFVENIKDEKLIDDNKFASFDVSAMYPSLPKYDVLPDVKNRINDNTFVTTIMDKILLRLFDALPNFLFTTSERKCHY